MYREDYSFLVKLCQRATILPASFSCSDTLQIKDNGFDAGASATVHRGSLDKKEVAVKNFRLYYFSVTRVKKRFIREALILQLAQHPNVLRFISILNEPFKLCIITPWYEHGHIMKYISAVPDAPLKELMEQVADGLHFLSEYAIVHGDLKGENVLIDNDGRAVIADFGSSTSISTLAATILSAASSGAGGTLRWMAPERLDPTAYDLLTQKATAKSDVYSFGMLVLEVFSGKPPWSSRAEVGVLLSVVASLRPPRPGNITDSLWEIVEKCWSHFPGDRPTIWEVYNRLACIP
ncbi:kinase-like domain-containing protein [Mycena epipterygia]|nr:kinase-like domain-containing protein [Mycena epipterygia]